MFLESRRTCRILALVAGAAAFWTQLLLLGPSAALSTERKPKFSEPRSGKAFNYPERAFVSHGYPVDLDGDNVDEILIPIANYPSSGPNQAESILVLAADPETSTYSDATRRFLGSRPPSFVHPRVNTTGDYNADGRLDVFLGGHGYDQEPFPGETDALLLSKGRRKHKTVAAAPEAPTFTHATASGDIDGDGIDDLYVGAINGGEIGPYFLLGRSRKPPRFANDRLPASIANRESVFTAAALVEVFGAAKDLVLGSDSGPHSIVVLRNDGAGRFTQDSSGVSVPLGLFGRDETTVVDILPIDINTDGRSDLLLSQTNLSYEGYGIQVLLREGSSFEDATSRALRQGSGFDRSALWRVFLYEADFFGDGLTDFVTNLGLDTPDSSFAWTSEGNGVFQPHPRGLLDSPYPYEVWEVMHVVPVEANSDGLTDLVLLIWLDEGVAVARTYLNLGPQGKAERPRIQRQPRRQVLDSGAQLLLSVSARGGRPLRFQWSRNGSEIPGATKPVLRIENTEPAQAGRYRVRVWNETGSATSKSVKVRVRDPS